MFFDVIHAVYIAFLDTPFIVPAGRQVQRIFSYNP